MVDSLSALGDPIDEELLPNLLPELANGSHVPGSPSQQNRHVTYRSAAELADARVAAVRDDPQARLALMRDLYQASGRRNRRHLPYRRAASAFMGWQLRRGLLNPPDCSAPGSPWWRSLNERLLLDGWEARALALGCPGSPSSLAVAASVAFIRRPNARNWYRAHNMTIVSGYLNHEDLAHQEGRVERFFINLVLVRVLYAHALVAAPRLALGWLAPIARPLGDPRLGMTGIFLSLSRVLPDRYPLGDDVDPFVEAEHGLGHLLDVGVIQPRVEHLYEWSARELDTPALRGLIAGEVPSYSWDVSDREPWIPAPTFAARSARRLLRLAT
jgi:hypothetical protein